ncbi:hypothetical protein PoB_000650600 [Plakobranchus ocellatus]|uniref:Uncharacterized protein n=1 Tax=Plakobranchus ocellatus TaxID=259542 RepID=A0AAV3XYH4_9GAST|nr:hypothetical protein PoB_000650600 [Plakobranchus ocellatus]
MYIASPQQGDLRLSDPLAWKHANIRARAHDRRVSANLTAVSLSTVPPTPLPLSTSNTWEPGKKSFGSIAGECHSSSRRLVWCSLH